MSVDWNLAPGDIERKSFAIIDDEAKGHPWDEASWPIVRRMIHTTADFDWVDSVRMHPLAIEKGIEAIRAGRTIITDTRMAQSGISAAKLAPFGVQVECLISHPDTVKMAAESSTTRAMAAVDLALERFDAGIYVVGNAPTALFRLLEQMAGGAKGPSLIVGLPVGFVNAAESKDALLHTDHVFITNVGRKGGSNVAACVINALAQMAGENWAPRN